MLSNRHVKMLLIWAFLTIFLMLSLLGVVAATNYSKIADISDQTCGTVGGRWVETTYQFICVVDKEWKE